MYIEKSNGKLRPLDIPVMRCRAMQALYLLALDPIAEVRADGNSYGFRRERSPADAIAQCFNLLARKFSPQFILEGDIRSCFNSISHQWLVEHTPINKVILTKWLKAGFIYKRKLYPTEEGSPQGSIISPCLANLTLDGLEKQLQQIYPKTTPEGQAAKVNFVRFADDFIVTGSSQELLEQEIKPRIAEFMRQRGLELSPEKTRVTQLHQGFDFLAQNIRTYHQKLLIQPSKQSIKEHLTQLREIIKTNKQVSAGKLLSLINPVIRGWVYYHRHVASKKAFRRVDNQIYLALWRWAKRRHRNKSPKWVKAKYFQTLGNRNWVFSGTIVGKDHQLHTLQLFRASSLPIKRHLKIRSKANPYDPNWESYFEERLDLKTANQLKGRRKLLYLWKEQGGSCPVCEQKITKLSGWHTHHLVERVFGGTDRAENLVLLHPNCHRQIHNRPDLREVKLRDHKGSIRKA